MLTETQIIAFADKYGPVPKVVSRLIRPALTAAPGHTLVWGDWSSNEARVLPWLSDSEGGDALLDVFRANDGDPDMPDVYKLEAAGIYDKDPYDVDKTERQVGKVAILALGFGGGVGALSAMAAGYGLALDDEFKRFIVDRWRARNPWAVRFWSELSEAFDKARHNPGTVHSAGRVSYVFNADYLGGSMFCYLPDGRPLTYADLRREKLKYEDDLTGEIVTEWKMRYQHGYTRTSVWHGILAENITQAVAASLLREALVRLELDWEFLGRTVGHTHDEVITECADDDTDDTRRALLDQMLHVPAWAEGLPLAAEVTDNWYYTKYE